MLFTTTVALSTIISVITVWTSQWKRTEFDPPIQVGPYFLDSIQYGPLFFCARNDNALFEGLDTNVACQLNFVDSSTTSAAYGFNVIKASATLTACFALCFYSSFWNKRAFYEYRSTILCLQIISAIITIALFESFGATDVAIDSDRDYVWATYSGGEKVGFAIGYVGFVMTNIIMPIVFLVILQWIICGTKGQTTRDGFIYCARRTCHRESLHAVLVMFFGFWYIYFASSSKWARKDLDQDEIASAIRLTQTNSLGYLLSTPAGSTNASIPAQWGNPTMIEQGPWSECIRFDEYHSCHMDLVGVEDRIRGISIIRIFMLGGIVTAIAEAILSIGRFFILTKEVYIFANIALPLVNLLCTMVALILWASAGKDGQLSNLENTKGIWAKGSLDVSWYGLLVTWFFYTGTCVYWFVQRNKRFNPPTNNTVEDNMNEPEEIGWREEVAATLPPDLFWTFVYGDKEDDDDFTADHEINTDPKKWWTILALGMISLILFGLASFQEWTEISIDNNGDETFIRTYLFGYQCTVYPTGNKFTVCDDGFKFSGTKTRMDHMQSIFSFYFISVVLLLWGIYEHVRNRMKPWYRTGWFAVTMLSSACGFGIFWNNGDKLSFVHYTAFSTQRTGYMNKILSDIYAGQDMTYIKDITGAADGFKIDVSQDEYFIGYVFACVLVAVVTGLQFYSAVHKYNAHKLDGGASSVELGDKPKSAQE